MLGFKRKDDRDIDRVIFDFAEHRRPRDRQRLLELLRGREIFASVAASSVPFEDGREIVVGENDVIQLRTGALPNGMTCVIFYVDRGDRRLGPNYVGVVASDAFEMASRMKEEALLIQNSQ